MKKSSIIMILFFLIIIILNGFSIQNSKMEEIKVFHAGSLSIPFKKIEKSFERIYPSYNVILEAAGSRVSVRKVTEIGHKADVIASADYTVIKELMMPEYTEWYTNFARNEMVIMYTDKSRYATKINQNNWYNILLKKDVEYGHSDPNADPAGYRSQLVWKLAEKYYNQSELFVKLQMNCPKKNIRLKSTDLIALLESSDLDYAFIYRSVAEQHKLPFVELPDQINLKSKKYANFYKSVSYPISGKRPSSKIIKRGRPMVYGVTIPENAPNKEGAVKFIKFLINTKGQKIMINNGQPPIAPSITNSLDDIPPEIKALVRNENNN
jgi:molybdate/tungstate transport system substrate-binding protein